MSNPKQPSDKDAAKEPKTTKPPEYRRFEDVLRKVIKAPPLKNSKSHG